MGDVRHLMLWCLMSSYLRYRFIGDPFQGCFVGTLRPETGLAMSGPVFIPRPATVGLAASNRWETTNGSPKATARKNSCRVEMLGIGSKVSGAKSLVVAQERPGCGKASTHARGS